MPVEIDESRLGNLTTIAQIADGLLKNPKTRKKYLEAVKEAHPQIPIPEIDAAEPINGEVQEIKKMVAETLETFRKERDEEKKDRQLSQVREKYNKGKQALLDRGYTPEGVADVEKFMEANNILDWEVAYKAYEYDNPRPSPARPTRGNYFDFIDQKNAKEGDDYIKKLFETGGQDESVIDGQISNVLQESRQAFGQMRTR